MPTLDAQLAALAALQAQLAAVASEHAARRQAALPRLIQRKLAQLDAAYAPVLAVLEREIAACTTTLKAAVLAHGHSVQGHGLHAVYVAGRVHWDDRALQGYAQAGHPELLAFRHHGAPSVSLRLAAAPPGEGGPPAASREKVG
jgi:hypothetical protein